MQRTSNPQVVGSNPTGLNKGKIMNPKLKMLCDLYEKANGDINPDALMKVCFFNDVKDILRLCSNRQCVKFAYLCAKSVFHLIEDENLDEYPNKCLELVDKWLNNPDSVSKQELKTSTFNITNNIYCSPFTINAIVCAVYTIYCFPYTISAENADCFSVVASDNKQEQERKNLGFLVQVLKEG